MAITLTVDQVLSNGKRVVIARRRLLKDGKRFSCEVQERTAINGTPADAIVSRRVLSVFGPQGAVAGSAMVIGKNTALAPGDELANLLKEYPPVSVNDTQWDALVAAHDGSVGALETLLLAAGYLHSTLAGA